MTQKTKRIFVIAALVVWDVLSVLTLQNTLIIVNDGGIRSDMFLLSAISSAVVFFSIVVISVRLIFRCRNAE